MQMNKRKLYIAGGTVKGFARSAHQTCSLTTLGLLCSVVVKLLYFMFENVAFICHSNKTFNIAE